MVKINHILAAVVWVAVCVTLARGSEPVFAFLFFVPFTLGPHAVTHALCFFLKSWGASILLAIAMLAYLAWFFLAYWYLFYFAPDAQSAIGLLFIGVVSLPVMIPVWVVALVLEGSAKSRVD